MKYFAESSNEIGLFWIWFVVFDIICAFIMCSYCGVISNKYRNTTTTNLKIKNKYKVCIILLFIITIIILPSITLFIGGFVNFLFYIITSIFSFFIGWNFLTNCWICNNDGNGIIDGDEFSEWSMNKKKNIKNNKYDQAELSHLANNNDIHSQNEIKNMLSYSKEHNNDNNDNVNSIESIIEDNKHRNY